MKIFLKLASNHAWIAILLFVLGFGGVWLTNATVQSVGTRQFLIYFTGAAGLLGVIAGIFAVLTRNFLRRHHAVSIDFSLEDAVREMEAQKWIGSKRALVRFVVAAVLCTQLVALAAGMLFSQLLG